MMLAAIPEPRTASILPRVWRVVVAGEDLIVGAIVEGANARNAPTYGWSLSMHPGFLRHRVSAAGRVDTFSEARSELRQAFDAAAPDLEGYRAHMQGVRRAAAAWGAIHRPKAAPGRDGRPLPASLTIRPLKRASRTPKAAVGRDVGRNISRPKIITLNHIDASVLRRRPWHHPLFPNRPEPSAKPREDGAFCCSGGRRDRNGRRAARPAGPRARRHPLPIGGDGAAVSQALS
jgi:hypothetical protein